MTNEKIISPEQGQEVADQYNMKFFETSAKTGQNIKEAFETVAA